MTTLVEKVERLEALIFAANIDYFDLDAITSEAFDARVDAIWKEAREAGLEHALSMKLMGV